MARWFSILVWFFFVGASNAQDEKMSETVKGLVKKMITATAEGDYRTVLDMTYPKVFEAVGGREKAAEEIEKLMKTIKSQGITFSVKDVGASTLAKGGKDHYSVTPITLVMTGLGKKISIKSAVVGVSEDGGKNWKFISIDNKGEKGVRTLLPNLPADLVIPKQEQKVEEGN